MNIFDLLLLFRKRIVYILAIAIAAAGVMYYMARQELTYTSTINILYKNPQAAEGFAPDGSKLTHIWDLWQP